MRSFACTICQRLWRQDSSALVQPRARLTHAAVLWGRALGLESVSISRVAAALTVAWHTAGTVILTDPCTSALLDDPGRFDGVEMLDVDDSPVRFALKWEVPPLCGATPSGATSTPAVIIDLTPVRDRSGPARLLDVVEGRSKKILKIWLAARDESWRQNRPGGGHGAASPGSRARPALGDTARSVGRTGMMVGPEPR